MRCIYKSVLPWMSKFPSHFSYYARKIFYLYLFYVNYVSITCSSLKLHRLSHVKFMIFSPSFCRNTFLFRQVSFSSLRFSSIHCRIGELTCRNISKRISFFRTKLFCFLILCLPFWRHPPLSHCFLVIRCRSFRPLLNYFLDLLYLFHFGICKWQFVILTFLLTTKCFVFLLLIFSIFFFVSFTPFTRISCSFLSASSINNVSSAYLTLLRLRPPIVNLSNSLRIISVFRMNNSGEKYHPCFTPLYIYWIHFLRVCGRFAHIIYYGSFWYSSNTYPVT